MKDGGPAFPHDFRSFNGVSTLPADGMTLRDWFAGQALMAWASAAPTWANWDTEIATSCYRVADAMLAARGDS